MSKILPGSTGPGYGPWAKNKSRRLTRAAIYKTKSKKTGVWGQPFRIKLRGTFPIFPAYHSVANRGLAALKRNSNPFKLRRQESEINPGSF
jgi:hypothetical protein